MTKFYKSTKYIWIVSRILLILFLSVAIFNRINETELSDLIVNAIFLIVIISMISLAVIGILKRKAHYGLRFTVGIFTILFGIVISYLLLTLGKTDYPIHIKMGFQLLPLWIMLYGIYELTNGINLIKGKQT